VPVLRLEDVSVTYRTSEGAVPAVRGVSLDLEAGTSLGVAGESGSGKSTLAATVLRLTPRSATVEGRVLLDGEDVLAMSFGRLRAVRWAEASIVFQGALHSLNPLHRVGRQIAEPVLLHDRSAGARRSVDGVVEALLASVGLPTRLASSYPHQLSGGQKQRVMIAMALACKPRLIVADEPTTALDVMVQAQVLDLLTSLVRELGVGLVVISHDLSVLATTCDRVAVMYAGRVVEEGPVAQVFEEPLHPYTAALLRALPTFESKRGSLEVIEGTVPSLREPARACSFAPRCRHRMARCEQAVPALAEARPAHKVACFLHGDARE
jgi:peptide/nickel transport system ATP-binding protein